MGIYVIKYLTIRSKIYERTDNIFILAMASLTALKKSLECVVCQEPQFHPKHLPCHHSFCKGCLDDMARFEHDGSAVIKCPMKCVGNVLIKPNETCNSLPSNYTLQSVLDVVTASYDRYVNIIFAFFSKYYTSF